jgi:hypothetical protein
MHDEPRTLELKTEELAAAPATDRLLFHELLKGRFDGLERRNRRQRAPLHLAAGHRLI